MRGYARRLVLHRWHSNTEWRALNTIVTEESHWDPCAVNPLIHDCDYQGPSSCGIPQAAPCPTGWRGRLFAARYGQVRWLIAYIAGRYGNPAAALAFHNANGWY